MYIFSWCSKNLTICKDSSTTNLLKHLKFHNIDGQPGDNPAQPASSTSAPKQKKLSDFVSVVQHKSSTIEVTPALKEKLDDAAIKCIIIDGRPFMDFEKSGMYSFATLYFHT